MRFSTTNILLVILIFAVSTFAISCLWREQIAVQKVAKANVELLKIQERFGLITDTASDTVVTRFFNKIESAEGRACRVRVPDFSKAVVHCRVGLLDDLGSTKTSYSIHFPIHPRFAKPTDIEIYYRCVYSSDQPRRRDAESKLLVTVIFSDLDGIQMGIFEQTFDFDIKDIEELNSTNLTFGRHEPNLSPIDVPVLAAWHIGRLREAEQEDQTHGVMIWVEPNHDFNFPINQPTQPIPKFPISKQYHLNFPHGIKYQ